MDSATLIIHGFWVGETYRSQVNSAHSPVSTRSSLPLATIDASKKKPKIFFAGTSTNGHNSLEDNISVSPLQQNSWSVELENPFSEKNQSPYKVNNRSHQDTSESAVEDDEDSSDWEDSVTDNGKSSVSEKHVFQRVDSRPNLVSRRSFLTTLIHQPESAATLTEIATEQSKSSPTFSHGSRTSISNGPSISASPEDSSVLTVDPRILRSRPIVGTASNTHSSVLSPRAIRSNMLAAELTESLPKHIRRERTKNKTVKAVLKRRHTAYSMANLRQYPSGSRTSNASNSDPWNHGYSNHGLGEYHQDGW